MSKPRWRLIGILAALLMLQSSRAQVWQVRAAAEGEAVPRCQAAAHEVYAVVDRRVDRDHVVLLVEPDGREWIVKPRLLPAGWKEGAWVRIAESECGSLVFAFDREATQEAMARVSAKLERLRDRSTARSAARSGVPPGDFEEAPSDAARGAVCTALPAASAAGETGP